jgi:hypothetical protein
MATVTSRRAKPTPKILVERRELAEQRLALERKLLPHYAAIDRLDAQLKKIATETGESFTEAFPKLGDVKVGGAIAAESKGEQPVLQTELWLELSELERKRLIKSGLVKLEQQWGRASSGRVTVKVFEKEKRA